MGVIEQVSIRCRFQGCNGPVLVAFVPFEDIRQGPAASSRPHPAPSLQGSGGRARPLGSGDDEIFTSACGQITVSNVAAIEHRARRIAAI